MSEIHMYFWLYACLVVRSYSVLLAHYVTVIGKKYVLKHQDLQSLVSIYENMSDFHPLEMYRDPQLHVGRKIK